jgi:hypothetical protein
MKPSSHTVSPQGPCAPETKVMRRRVEITVEREVLSVVYQPAAGIVGRCEQCGRDVLLLSPQAAAATRGVSPREIYRWLDEKELHFQELESGTIFLCSESLKTAPYKELP